MIKKKFVPIALFGLLFASPLVLAEEAHHPEEGTEAAVQTAPAEVSKDADTSTPTAPDGMMMGGQGMMGGPSGMMQGRGGKMGMMQGGKGGGMGMMRQHMMECMQGNDIGKGGMMMGRGGKMGMMHGGKGGGMHKKHRQLIGRLDLIEARMAKIETMLERLLLR